jgi:hypothetical protein
MPPASDPIRQLQYAARQVATQFVPGSAAAVVKIADANGKTLFTIAVPPAVDCPEGEKDPDAAGPAGWDVSERSARYDGKHVAVAASRLKLLKVLVEAEGALSGKELARLAFAKGTTEDNVGYHVKSLRGELQAAFPTYEGDPIPSDGGYLLSLR